MKIDFFVWVCVWSVHLASTDSLSKTLQTLKLSAANGQNIAELTCKTLERICTDDSFKRFWEKALRLQQTLGISEPSLLPKRKAPKRPKVSTGEGSHTPRSFILSRLHGSTVFGD